MSLPPAITLVPPGPRERVSEDRAQEYISVWKAELASHKTDLVKALAAAKGCAPDQVREEDIPPLCCRVVLKDKAYTAAAAEVLYHFFTREIDGAPSLARGVTELDASDVIASLSEEEGLQVLRLISDAFAHAKLVDVDLSDNAMGSKGLGACRSVLGGQADTLERLSLCNNGLSAEAMGEVAEVLTGSGEAGEGTEDDALASDGSAICERLTKLHFFNNMSGDGGCRAVARILHRCGDGLVDLRFSSTRAGPGGSAVVAAALDEMGDKVKNLRRLDLEDNTFQADSSVALLRALGRMQSLTYLNLRDCGLEDDGTQRVCHALFGAVPPLEHLDLSGNEITAKGASGIADLLEETPTLRVLHAEENELTSIGVKKIAKAIYRLSMGEADGEGEGEGGAAAGARCALEELKLGTNQCGPIGARALLDAYRGGEGIPKLRLVDLDGNGFPLEDVDMLTDAFGDKLREMEDNDDEAEFDDELESEGEDDDEEDGGGDDEDNVGRAEGADAADQVNQLAEELAKGANISPSHTLV